MPQPITVPIELTEPTGFPDSPAVDVPLASRFLRSYATTPTAPI